MSENNFNFPTGLSWGTRGFRVGKSAYGNWWLSVRLPFGFRYMHVFRNRPAKTMKQNYSQPQPIQNVIAQDEVSTPSLKPVDKQHSKIKNRA